MRKRKDSHDGSPVADTNLLFVPSSSDDSSESGVDALMGMIDEAGAQWAGTPGCAACHPWVSPGVAVRERRGTS